MCNDNGFSAELNMRPDTLMYVSSNTPPYILPTLKKVLITLTSFWRDIIKGGFLGTIIQLLMNESMRGEISRSERISDGFLPSVCLS